MDPTNPDEAALIAAQLTPPVEGQQGTPDKTNVQSRIDELTAEKYAKEKQIAELTSTVAELMRRTNEQMVARQSAPTAPAEEPLPEGIDPVFAKFLKAQIESVKKETLAGTQQLYWQLQNQMDQSQVSNKYGHLPPEVLKDAAGRLTALKQRYGNDATMDDAVALAHFAWAQKQAQVGRVNQFNQMGGPMTAQGAPPSAQQQQSSGMVSPASLPNWDKLDNNTQNKLIDAWEKGGGTLLG